MWLIFFIKSIGKPEKPILKIPPRVKFNRYAPISEQLGGLNKPIDQEEKKVGEEISQFNNSILRQLLWGGNR